MNDKKPFKLAFIISAIIIAWVSFLFFLISREHGESWASAMLISTYMFLEWNFIVFLTIVVLIKVFKK